MASRCYTRCGLSCLVVVAVSLAGAGCTYTTDGTGRPGTLTVNRLGTLPNPPPAPSPDAVTPPSGAYEGVAQISSNPGGACRRQFPVRNFIVTDDMVRFEAFRGTLQPDMSVRLQGARSFIQGSFDGGNFTGRLWQQQPSCTYDLVLTHIG
jgi:hypothetical protein